MGGKADAPMTAPSELQPFVSVVIPVYRNPDGLRKCLGALAGQSYPRDHFEVVVIDNGSNGDLESLTSDYGNVVLCHESTPGSYAARNTGLRIARGTLIAFTDSDCIPDKNWLAAGVEVMTQEPYPDVIGGNVVVFGRNPERLGLFETHQVVKGFYHESQIRDQRRGSTANVFTTRKMFEKVGPFRADFQSGGDREWSRRALSHGYSLEYAPGPIVHHPARHRFWDFSLRYLRTTGGMFVAARAEGTPTMSLRQAIHYLTPPFAETRRHSGHPALQAPLGSVKFFVAEYWLRVMRLFETTRLLLGGKPVRY